MATTILEDNLEFTFGDRWQVAKYDATTTYRQGIEKLKGVLGEGTTDERNEGSKATDIVGWHPDFGLLLMEIKDFRKHRIENKKRIHRELALEVALKSRDTVAGLLGAWRGGKAEGVYDRNLKPTVLVKVVLWIESDETGDKRAWSDRLRALNQDMARKLRWLSVHCLAVGKPLGGNSIPDLHVKYRAQAGN